MEDTHIDVDASMEYRGEGSCSIVLAIPKSHQVLRLVKSAYTKKIQKRLEERLGVDATCQDVQEAVKDQLISAINYIKNIVQPMLSEDYVIVPTLACVPQGFMHKVLAVTEAARPDHGIPVHRKTSQNLVDYDVQWALILPDCCFIRNKRHNKSSMNHFLSSNLFHEGRAMKLSSLESSNEVAPKLDSFAACNVVKNSSQSVETQINSKADTLDPLAHSKNFDAIHRQTSACHNASENKSSASECLFTVLSSELGINIMSLETCESPSENCMERANGDISRLSLPHEDHTFFECSGIESNQGKSEEHMNAGDQKDDINSMRSSTLSFEIKPKKAFILPTTESTRRQSQTCKFCRHQCLKTKSGKFSELSGYCPLNLFSGDREQMRHALFALIKTPQHNLKICKDGKEVYGSEIRQDLGDLLSQWFPQWTKDCSSTKDKFVGDFVDIIIETLLYSPEDSNVHSTVLDTMTEEDSALQNSISAIPTMEKANGIKASIPQLQGDRSRLGEKICNLISPFASDAMNLHCANSLFPPQNDDGNSKKSTTCLPRGCVLEQIRRMQLLDYLDIETVYPLFNSLITEQKGASELSNWNLNGPYTDLSWIVGHKINPAAIQEGDKPQLEEDLLKVKRFLVSKTFQDCSIIVAIRPSIQKAQEPVDFRLKYQDTLYDFSVSIIDLDPKPFDKIPFYFSQAMEIASAFDVSS